MSHASRLERLTAGRPVDLANTIAASRMVFRVAHLMEKRINQALAPFDIDMREYLALVLIADDAVEALRPSDLSTTLDATRTQITRLLDGLEKKELAQRSPGIADRRSLSIALTDKGRSLMRSVAPTVHAAYESGWSAVGPAGTVEALGLLRRIHRSLSPADDA